MKKMCKIVSIVLLLFVLVLELLPYGAVLNFTNTPDGGGYLQYTYSYFDVTTFGFANFGPLLTAILTCILMILSLLSLFVKKMHLQSALFITSILAFLMSLMPLILGVAFYSFIGIMISFLLALYTSVQWYMKYKVND